MIDMGVISDLVSGGASDEYTELTDKDLTSSPRDDAQVGFIDVKNQDDLVTAKENLQDGLMVILDISYIESNGLSLSKVYEEMEHSVEAVNGDIVHKKRNDIIVVTPRDVSINRQKLS